MTGARILLIVGGGIAAYKSCELVRLIRRAGGTVTCVVTEGGQQFVTPMALAALSGRKVYTSLFDLKDEVEMGHIQLSREADLVVVCPATADLMAKMAAGIADDLATTLILATDKPVLAVPAMNVRMWEHGATRRNAEWLRQAGVIVMAPDEGEMACGEWGPGRLPEPLEVLKAIGRALAPGLALDLPEPDPPVSSLPPPPLPALAPAPAPGHALPVDGDFAREALEPEPEPEPEPEHPAAPPSAASRLSSLFSAIIPRATPRRSHAEIDAEIDAGLDALPDPPPGAAEPDGGDLATPDLAPDLAPDRAPHPAPAAGPLLATKGRASAAPPTDREALNHAVAGMDPGARPLADSHAGALPEWQSESPPASTLAADPLAGQVEFDANPAHRPLHGRHVIVTAGPTWEPIDPVRYIANRSSGKQGFAIAAMAAAAGARVTLVAGPVNLPTPLGVDRVDVESATEMAEAVRRALPADIAFMVAAVADWRSRTVAGEKMKKRGSAPPALLLTENPDILATLGASRERPRLLIGFAAETEHLVDNAVAKRRRKGADWIVANDVSQGEGRAAAGNGAGGVMGGDRNQVHICTAGGVETLPPMAKEAVARELVHRAAAALVEMEAGHGG